MRSKKRLLLITMMLLSMIACIIGAVACGGGVSAKDAIANYLLPQDQTLVSADFTLPKGIGKDNSVPVTWTSSNENAIKIEDADTVYNAKVTLQDEVTEVTLTIHSGDNQKGFTVRVDELSVYTFISNFTFPQKNRAVKEDFELQTSMTIQGQAATISWTVPAGSQDYLSVVDGENGKKMVKVDLPEDIADVKIEATFSFKGVSKTQTYNFSVSPDLEPLQLINRIYSRTDYPVELSGYVLHVYSSGNSDQYGPNATFYMIDDTLKYGYYMYQLALNEEDLDNFKEGVHVSVSGDKAKNYNGLWETNGKEVGKAVIIDDKTINPREHIYDFDTDLISGVPSALWHESTYVRLTGWTVKEVKTAPKVGTAGDLFTITNGEKTITVRYSTYIKRTDEENAALVDVCNTVKKDDIVTVTGILGNYNAFQIQPVVAGDIVVGGEAKTYENAPKVKAAVAAVDAKVKDNFNSLVAADKTVKMPVEIEGVTISYKLAGKLTEPTVVIGTDGTFTITPTQKEKNYEVQVTYKIGDYEAYGFFQIHNWKKTDAEIVELVKKAIDEESGVIDLKAAGEIALPEVDTLGATVTWSVDGGTPVWISIADGKVTAKRLPNEATTITLVATITKGEASASTTVTVKAAAAPDEVFQSLSEPKAGDYIFGLYQAGLEKWLYATGESKMNGTNGPFGVTTEDYTKAAKFTLTAVTDGWTIQLKSDGKYLELNDKHVWTYSDTSTKVWKWNEEAKVFTLTLSDEKTYYLGTYGTFDTISASTIDRITGKNLNSPSQYVAHFGNIVKMSSIPETEKAAQTLDAVKTLSKTSFSVLNEEFELPIEPNTFNADIVWRVSGTTDLVTVENNTLKIVKLPTASTEVTLEVSVTVGETTQKDTVKITVKPAVSLTGKGTATDPYTVADAIALAGTVASGEYLGGSDSPTEIYVKGYVVKVDGWSDTNKNWTKVYIADTKDADASDKTKAAQVYRLALDDTYLKTQADLLVGAEITIFGCLEAYEGKAEVCHNPKTNVNCKAVAYKAPEGADLDQAKVDAEVAAVKDSYTVTEAGDYTLPTPTDSTVTFAWVVKGTSSYQVTNEKKLAIGTELPDEATTVTLTLTATLNEATASKDVTFNIAAKGDADKFGTLEAPLTVAQALAIAKALPSGNTDDSYSAQAAYVKGYVIDVGTWTPSETYGDEWKNAYIADSKDSTKTSADAITVFYIHTDDTFLKLSGDLIKGCEIVVYGYLQNFAYDTGKSGTPEISDHGSVKTKAVAYTVTDQQKVDAAVAAVGNLSSNSVTEDVELPACTVTGVTFAWAVNKEASANAKIQDGKVVVTRTADDVTVTLTLTATCGTSATKTETYTLKVLSESAKAAEVLYTLDTTVQGGSNTYAGSGDVTVGTITWAVGGNNKPGAGKPWRFGGKDITGVDRKLTGKGAIDGTVSKIVISFGECSITVNSVTLKIYTSDPTADDAPSPAFTKDIAFEDASTTVTIEAGVDETWENCYFELVFNVTNTSTSSNKYITVDKIVFWGFPKEG